VQIYLIQEEEGPHQGEWHAWATLPHIDADEVKDAGESFIIGVGTSKTDAALAALTTLNQAKAQIFEACSESRQRYHSPAVRPSATPEQKT
jgi:hypothetical protein